MEEAFVHLSNADKKLAKLINFFGPLSIDCPNKEFSDFEFLVREITGQCISNSAKRVLVSRLLELCDGLLTPRKLSTFEISQLRAIGLSMSKSTYILNLAQLILDKKIDFDDYRAMSDADVLSSLTSVRGIGNWTAKMYLLFFLRRDNILPYEDGAFLQAFKWLYDTDDISKKNIIRICKPWSPYSSVGARYMYKALDAGLTKIPVIDFIPSTRIEKSEQVLFQMKM